MFKKGFAKRIVAGIVSLATLATSVGTGITATTMANAADYDNFAKELQYSLYFYDGNMCGKNVGETSAFSWRDDCHTGDAADGGFHDAGDNVKFGLPAGYSASTLGWGYYEYGDVYDSLGQTAHLKEITDYFCTYFKNCTTLSGSTVTNFIYQVGNGDADHATWCAPEVMDQSTRQAYSTTSGASDIAAEYAAALAVNYINFGNSEDLKYAKALYEFSTKYNTVTDEGTTGFYTSEDYYDDQAWAAGWLYLATNDSTYKTFLNTFANSNGKGKSGQAGILYGVYTTMCWNNVSMGAAILQAEITNSATDWQKLLTYFNNKCSSESQYYCESEWGSARYNTALQMCALISNKHFSTINKNSWAKAQMEMILGNNSKNVNLIVGMDSNSAKYAHHRAASGYSNYDEMGTNTTYSSNGHTLTGALVGGPGSSDFSSYNDLLTDYKTNEVAIDYNAAVPGAAAALYSNYKTGSVDSNVNGVGAVTNTVVTTAATTKTTSSTTKTTTSGSSSSSSSTGSTSVDYTEGTETGESGASQIYWEFAPLNYKTVTVTYKVTSSDTETSGAFGTWTGTWDETTFKETVGSSKEVSVTYTIPSNVGSTVKCSVYWPTSDSIQLVSITGSTGTATSTAATTKATTATTKTTTKTTAATTKSTTAATTKATTAAASSGSGTNATITEQDTKVGDDGAVYNYVRFDPSNAKTATIYMDITSTDTEWSGAWAYCKGSSYDWQQTDVKGSVSGGTAKCTIDLTSISENLPGWVEFDLYYPASSSSKITKVVLDEGSSSSSSSSSSSTGSTSVEYTEGTETGESGATQIYWEFAPLNYKTVTVTYQVTSTDTETSGAFGTWTGTWDETAFKESVGSNKQVSVTYTIPSNVGSTVKCSVYWPTADSVKLVSIVGSTGTATTTATTKATTTATTKTTTKTTAKTTATTKATTKTTTAGNTYTGTASLYGDVNADGVVNLSDVVLLNKALVGSATLSNTGKPNADCMYDGSLDSKDSLVILKYLVGTYTSLPQK